MALRLGEVAPNFNTQSTIGALDFYDWLGDSWCMLCLRSGGFTPICATEIVRTAELKKAFDARGVKIIAGGKATVDQFFFHLKDIQNTHNLVLDFPLVADAGGQIASLYGMLPANNESSEPMCSLFIIGPDKRIKLTTDYPPSTGRNFHEILRAIDSLQLTDGYDVATPVDWEWGEDVFILPTLSEEAVEEKFPKGYEMVKPYMRVTPQPVLE